METIFVELGIAVVIGFAGFSIYRKIDRFMGWREFADEYGLEYFG